MMWNQVLAAVLVALTCSGALARPEPPSVGRGGYSDRQPPSGQYGAPQGSQGPLGFGGMTTYRMRSSGGNQPSRRYGPPGPPGAQPRPLSGPSGRHSGSASSRFGPSPQYGPPRLPSGPSGRDDGGAPGAPGRSYGAPSSFGAQPLGDHNQSPSFGFDGQKQQFSGFGGDNSHHKFGPQQGFDGNSNQYDDEPARFGGDDEDHHHGKDSSNDDHHNHHQQGQQQPGRYPTSNGFGNSGFSKGGFGNSGFGNSGFGNSGFGNGGFGNGGFGNSFNDQKSHQRHNKGSQQTSSSRRGGAGGYSYPGQQGFQGGDDDDMSEDAMYSFEYNVEEADDQGPQFGQHEEREGDMTRGSYHVLLPDGRLQRVDYEADERGFRPTVSFEDTRTGDGRGQDQGNGPY